MNTKATIKAETAERIEFLTDCLVGAVEHHRYGWFDVDEWEPSEDGTAYALVTEQDEEQAQHRLDLDTVRKGLQVIRDAKLADIDAGVCGVDQVLANAETGERLYLAERYWETIAEADRENDATEIDVVLALAIVECGLFGQVRYA